MADKTQCYVCQKQALQRCSGCHNVFYCSRDHQKADWKQHKKNCQPFKIASDGSVGRYLVATKDIKRNDIILREKPLIYGPSQETIPVCLGCNQEITTENYRECSKCLWPMCSEKCESNSCHLPECHYTIKSKEKIQIEHLGTINHLYQCITVLRCLYQREHNPHLWKKLNMLESHCEERKSTERYFKEKLLATEFIQKLFKLETQFTVDEIMKICGVIMINAHEVPLSEPPYIAIYEKTSMFENDCSSNCSKSFTSSGELLITSGVQINDGDHLSICYADPLWNTLNRRNFLYETKYFWCSCKRCSDTTEFGTHFSAVCCQNGLCNGFLLPETFLETDAEMKNWSCTKCDYTVTNLLVNTLCDKIAQEVCDLDKENVEACKCFLKKLQTIIPPNNFHIVDVKLALCQLIGQLSLGGFPKLSSADLELKRSLCVELVELTETLIPSEKRVRGLILFELHASLAEIARRRSTNFLNLSQVYSILEESRYYLRDCIDLLKYEPHVLPEGKICEQARTNLRDMIQLLPS